MEPTPFKIRIPLSTISDLNRRLGQTRWPDEIADQGWESGANLAYMKELVHYWRTQFNWQKEEEKINSFSHFLLELDDQVVHFVYERGDGPNPIPIIITHGWPGSFLEMLKIIPLLTNPTRSGGSETDSFDVIVPSIPGYGFSSRPSQTGMNAFRIAELWMKLMKGLGYDKFAAQGGDWGASISTCLGLNHPESLIGLHLNYIPGSYKPFIGLTDSEMSINELAFQKEQQHWIDLEGGYGHIQGTKPQTLSYGLNDSPAGLAAWIVEKMRKWSDCEGSIERRFSKDEILTNITLYWVTETIHSSIRLYQEGRRRPLHFPKDARVNSPCAIARFPKEAPFPPREWIERGYNVQRWTEMPRGGHFAAWEEPDLLAQDLRAFFRHFR